MSPPLRLLVLLLIAAPAASAQMLPSGTYAGTLTDGGDRHAVTAAIERCAGGFTLALDVAGRTAEVPEDTPATWERGRLTFTTSRVRLPGRILPRALSCDLRADDLGALAGTCAVGGDEVRVELAPPADASFGCD